MNQRGERPRRARRRLSQDEREFERLVAEAIGGLPERFRRRLANVDVVVEEEPSAEELAAAGQDLDEPILGLYQGTPLTQRTSAYGMVLPDKISIYRGPITRFARSRRAIREEVRQTIVHEFAHHFGLGDDGLDELGL